MSHVQNLAKLETFRPTALLVTSATKKWENVGILNKAGGGLPKSHFFCNLTKWFLACQIHYEVLKHVLQ